MPALTAEHLRIPLTAAAWYWNRRRDTCRALGIDQDELEGIAGLALTEAIANYDLERSPTGEEFYGSYLVQQVRWRINSEVRKRSMVGRFSPASLETELSQDLTLADTLASPDDRLATVEARELATLLLARLSPAERETVRCVWMEGHDMARAGQYLGLTYQAVAHRLDRVRERLARVPQFRRWARETMR